MINRDFIILSRSNLSLLDTWKILDINQVRSDFIITKCVRLVN